jgi:hypothetical protein
VRESCIGKGGPIKDKKREGQVTQVCESCTGNTEAALKAKTVKGQVHQVCELCIDEAVASRQAESMKSY